MNRLVPADPASLSAAGAAAVRSARELEEVGHRVEAAYGHLAEQWRGARARGTLDHGTLVRTGLSAVSGQLARLGVVLQDEATELAELAAQSRALVEEIATAGLILDNGKVGADWGIRGEANAGEVAAHAARRDDAQRRLDLLRARYARRRDELLADLEESRIALTEVSTALRLG